MDLQQLHNEIITCLWSRGLRAKIEETGFTFTEQDLLGIAFRFAPSFDERLRLLQLIADHFPAVADRAARCIAWQKEILAQFKTKGDHEIFELRIREEPNAYEERYLCESFDAALEMIDGFYNEYDCATETERSRYSIEKRKIHCAGQPFDEDGLGECLFSAGKVLLSVYAPFGETENSKCPDSCPECANPCVSNIEVYFPTFIPDRAPVRCCLPDGSTRFGIHMNSDRLEIMESCYVIPLDGEMLKRRRYDEFWSFHCHEHIFCPYVEEISVKELEQELQENYHAFVAWLDSNPE